MRIAIVQIICIIDYNLGSQMKTFIMTNEMTISIYKLIIISLNSLLFNLMSEII